jgi:hypothetical protein
MTLTGRKRQKNMAKKRKKKTFKAVTAVKALARERIGAPPESRIVPDRKKQKNEKHKTSVADLIEEL